jgi:Rieske Fe-S protein
MKSTLIRFLPFLLLVSFSCAKDGQTSNPIPYVAVSATLNMDNPLYNDLNRQGGSDTLDNIGYKGIIVVHDFSDNFWAYDRACPFHINSSCGKVTMGSLKLICGHYSNGTTFHPCCDSQYSLDGGNVQHGPTTFPLRRYSVAQNGQILTITN